MWLKTIILSFLVLNTGSTDGNGNQLSTEGSQLDSNSSKPADSGEEGVSGHQFLNLHEITAKTLSLEEMQTIDEFGWPTTTDPSLDFSTEDPDEWFKQMLTGSSQPEVTKPELESKEKEAKKDEEDSRWQEYFIYFYAIFGIILCICFGVFIAYDIQKTRKTATEDREKYIIEKHKELDRVGNPSPPEEAGKGKPKVTGNEESKKTLGDA